MYDVDCRPHCLIFVLSFQRTSRFLKCIGSSRIMFSLSGVCAAYGITFHSDFVVFNSNINGPIVSKYENENVVYVALFFVFSVFKFQGKNLGGAVFCHLDVSS